MAPSAMAAMSLPLARSPAPTDLAVELLTREEPALRRVMARYVRDAATVDDVFQEVSLKVLRRIDSVRDPAALRGWVFQLARNACLDHLRREDRRPVRSGDEALGEPGDPGDLGRAPADRLMSQERLDAVRRALERLPASQREVIRLRVDEGLDHAAIAARLGISREAVEVRLCRGRAALKAQLDAVMGGEL